MPASMECRARGEVASGDAPESAPDEIRSALPKPPRLQKRQYLGPGLMFGGEMYPHGRWWRLWGRCRFRVRRRDWRMR